MNDEDQLELYQYRLFKKLTPMQQTERGAFMADLFGQHWIDTYNRLVLLYPELSNNL